MQSAEINLEIETAIIMNVILTRQCMNTCPYCFASHEMSAPARCPSEKIYDSISIENIDKLAVWLANDPPEHINLIGGEPFLHDKLTEIVSTFRENCPKSHLNIFTGGIVTGEALLRLRPNDLSGILVNINEERDYPDQRKFTQVIDFIETALLRGFRVALGFNIWRLDFDREFLPRLAYSLGRQGFRWSVANPNLIGGNNVIVPSSFKQLSKRIVEMLHLCTSLGLTTTLDCHIPMCFFDDDDLSWIARYHTNILNNIGSCSPPIDITPELEAMRCFSLSALMHTPIDQHYSIKELSKWFIKNQDNEILAHRGIFKECPECPHFLAGKCQGGCLGWRNLSQQGGWPTPDSFYSMLREGKYRQVIEELESTSRWFMTPLLYYLGALAAQGLHDRDRSRRFTLMGLEHAADPNIKQKLLEILPPLFD